MPGSSTTHLPLPARPGTDPRDRDSPEEGGQPRGRGTDPRDRDSPKEGGQPGGTGAAPELGLHRDSEPREGLCGAAELWEAKQSLGKASEGAAGKKHQPKIGSVRNRAESEENGEDDQYLKTSKRTANSFHS